MSPLPKRRWSSRRQGKKRRTIKAKSETKSRCLNCGEIKISHQICHSCGYYNGKQIIKINKKNKEKSLKS